MGGASQDGQRKNTSAGVFKQDLSQGYEHLLILLDTYKNWVKWPRHGQPQVSQSVEQDALINV